MESSTEKTVTELDAAIRASLEALEQTEWTPEQVRRALEGTGQETTEFQLIDLGDPGDPIPGTSMVRDYCRLCDEKIAISPSEHLGMRCCVKCEPRAATTKPRPRLVDPPPPAPPAEAIV